MFICEYWRREAGLARLLWPSCGDSHNYSTHTHPGQCGRAHCGSGFSKLLSLQNPITLDCSQVPVSKERKNGKYYLGKDRTGFSVVTGGEP